ncbi:MAG: DUF4229 domain-containing protein [Candidatus Phosphoribacter sp.]
MLKYSVLRIGLFAVCFAVIWAVWLRGLESDFMSLVRRYPDQVFWALVAAAVISMIVSLFGLRRMREDISQSINDRVNARLEMRARNAAEHPERRSARSGLDADAADEDAEADR